MITLKPFHAESQAQLTCSVQFKTPNFAAI